jgi:hypothetical protein
MKLRFSKKPPAVYRKNPELYGNTIPAFKFDSQTENFITSNPTLMDPLDRANIRIGTSRIPGVSGDALIARRDIPAFTTVAYYCGVQIPDSEVLSFHYLRLEISKVCFKCYSNKHSL